MDNKNKTTARQQTILPAGVLAEKQRRSFIVWGLIFITVAFFSALVFVRMKGIDEHVSARLEQLQQSYQEVQTKLSSAQKDFDGLQKEMQQLVTTVPDTIIVNTESGNVVLTRGGSKGIRQGSAYTMYKDGKLLGYFKIDSVFSNVSFGHVFDYTKDYPQDAGCFKLDFAE